MHIFSSSSQADDTLLSLTPRTTDLSSEGLRRAWSGKIKDAALFSARTTKDSYLHMIRKFLGDVASGSVTPQVAESKLRQTLQNLGYRPETGFPDDEGRIPPATPGSIQDLSSSRRIGLIFDTNIKQARSLGQIASSDNPMNLYSIPAWKLTRTGARKKPRGDWKKRWKAAGDACGWEGAAKSVFVALKTSPIWKMIAKGAGGFKDTIGAGYPPFAFGSGMAWVGVPRRDWMRICERENMASGDELRLEAARRFKDGLKSIEKRPSAPLQERAAKDIDKAIKRDTARISRGLRDDIGGSVPILRDEPVSEAKTKAKRGISEARRIVGGYISALSERYIPVMERTREQLLKHSRERAVDASAELRTVESALAECSSSLEKMRTYDKALAKMYLTVATAKVPNGVFAKQDFETRIYRFLVASGRYEDHAISQFKRCKDANGQVKAALANFKQKLTLALS